MISLLARPQDGNPTTPEKYRKRLTEVLGDEPEATEGCPTECSDPAEEVPESLDSLACGEPIADANDPVPAEPPTVKDESAQCEQTAAHPPERVELGSAARQIADTIVGTFGQAIQDLHLRVSTGHSKLEAAAGTALRVSREIHQLNTDFLTLSTRSDAQAVEQTQLLSQLTAIDGRMSAEEQRCKRTQERFDELLAAQETATQQLQACTGRLSALEARVLQLCDQLGTLDSSLQSQIDTGSHLRSLCAKSDQLYNSLSGRVDSHEEMIFLLRNEAQQPVGMLERVLGTLRAMDLRKETRFPVDETVTVKIEGDPETVMAGRIVDASEHGLRLLLEGPLQPACKVRVESNDASLAGTVAYCIPKGEKHAIGLKLSQSLHGKVKSSGQAT